MSIAAIEQDFRARLAGQISLEPEGLNRYRVFTPFRLEDGDHLSIVLRAESGGWTLSDEGNMYMRLTYDIEEAYLHSGVRQQIISDALSVFQVEDRDGELALPVPGELYGDALFSFVQALLKIADLSYLSRGRVISAFKEDFQKLLSEVVPEERRQFDWHDAAYDESGHYLVDCRVNGIPRPLYIFALSSDTHTRDATIALHRFGEWGFAFHPTAIFENQESIGRKVLARFSDVCERQFSTLAGNKERITDFLQRQMR